MVCRMQVSTFIYSDFFKLPFVNIVLGLQCSIAFGQSKDTSVGRISLSLLYYLLKVDRYIVISTRNINLQYTMTTTLNKIL